MKLLPAITGLLAMAVDIVHHVKDVYKRQIQNDEDSFPYDEASPLNRSLILSPC